MTIDQLNIEIKSDSTKAINSLDKLKKTLGKLDGATSKISTTNVKTASSFSSLTTKITKTVGKLAIMHLALKRVSDSISDCFVASNEYIENLNLFRVTMGDAADEALRFAETVQSVLGINVNEWTKFQGTFQQLATGFGVAAENANVMSKNLTQLSYDLASFFNTKTQTASEKLASAMAGQVKGLRAYGIDTSIAALKTYALSKGITQTVASMDQAQRTYLRYNLIMEKSTKIQGDMARTIATPANSLRILNAQWERMQIAIGNVVSVVVVKLIPYVQAFIRLAAEAADALARLWGFKMPEIDYSGLSSAFSDADDDAEGLSDTVGKIKKQLMGFDEINILGSGTGGSGSGAGSGDLGIKPIDYDFLKHLDQSEAVEKIYKKMKSFFKDVFDWFDKWKGAIKNIAKLLVGIWAVGKISKFVTWIGKAYTAFKSLTIIRKISGFVLAFADGMQIAREGGVKGWQAIKTSIQGARDTLSVLDKAVITTATTITSYLSSKDFFYNMQKGTLSVEKGILDVGLAVGSIALAFATTGPVGAIVTGLGFVLGAVVGVNKAIDETMTKASNDAFYSGTGIKISDLAKKYDEFTQSIININQPIIDAQESLTNSYDSLDTTKEKIDNISTAIELGAYKADEKIPELQSQFEKLRDDTKTVLDEIYNNIIYAVSGSLSQALADAGTDVGKIIEVLSKVKGEADQTFESLTKRAIELKAQYDLGQVSSSDYANELKKITDNMTSLVGNTNDATSAFDGLDKSIGDIDWGNEEAKNDFFNSIAESTEKAKSSADEALKSVEDWIKRARGWKDDPEFQDTLDAILASAETTHTSQIQEIKDKVNELFDTVQADIILKSQKVADEAAKEWENMDFVKQYTMGLFKGINSQDAYVQAQLENYKKKIIDPISGKIESSMGALKTDGSAWASNAMKDIISEMFDTKIVNDAMGGGYATVQFKKDLGSAINDTFNGLGSNAISGYVKGIEDNSNKIKSPIDGAIKGGIEAAKKAQNSHSPSKEYEGLAKDAIAGYINPFNNNRSVIVTAITNAINAGINAVRSLSGTFSTEGKNSVEAYANSVSGNFYLIINVWNSKLNSLFAKMLEVFNADTWGRQAKAVSEALKNNLTLPTFKSIKLDVIFNADVPADKKAVYEALGLAGLPTLKWSAYASGGFPKVGEAFIARESGPELVGTIGNKTAVANNQQIVEGITAGVYKGVTAAMASNRSNGGRDANINVTLVMDGEKVTQQVIKTHNNMVRSTGRSPLAGVN